MTNYKIDYVDKQYRLYELEHGKPRLISVSEDFDLFVEGIDTIIRDEDIYEFGKGIENTIKEKIIREKWQT